jgi:hypothetical protein
LVRGLDESDVELLGARRPRAVFVRRAAGGVWEVLLPDATGWTAHETLSAARRVAFGWAEANPPSEVIVRDAYHRVVLRRSFRDPNAAAVS